ncbi:Ferroporti-1 [Podospora appendiculata]|uniref:Solute carrier family 40 member n=1 Tax=Podospora appendiculata TaxID=314037 RepID=A0AAE0XET1_9PEZI|nr:Ferroporti-1 [Podospora appendiculata]
MSSEPNSEETPLLLNNGPAQTQPRDGMQSPDRHPEDEGREIKKGLLWRLYVSHFLSTWNMRSYEFTVILLFVKAYPNTLLPTSIRGILTNGATLLLSPAIGRWVDRNASRFHTIKTTILVQRAAIVAGCLLWILLFSTQALLAGHSPSQARLDYQCKTAIVAVLMLLGIVERVCAVGNMLVMERDWVPTIASEVSDPPLHQLNAIMRRIDLVSKILAPVFVSVVYIRDPLYLAAVAALMNLATVGVELATARSAWTRCTVLRLAREPKAPPEPEDDTTITLDSDETTPLATPATDELAINNNKKGLRLYFSSDVCLASLSTALQSFSILSLSGPMTTYLLQHQYTPTLLTTVRTLTSVLEIGSTILFPLSARLLTTHTHADPIPTLGLAGVTFQLLLLTPCFIALVLLPQPTSPTNTNPAIAHPVLTALVFGSLGLSRLGHWTHNMAVQQIVQTRVPAGHRVEFSGVEMAAVSAAEIGRWAAAAVWSRPGQFVAVAALGLGSVVVVWALFVVWVWLGWRRGRGRVRRLGVVL